MSPEEAIRTIEFAISEVEWEHPMDYAAAFDTAISALRAQQKAEKNNPLTPDEPMTLDDAIKHLEETLSDPEHDWGCESCKEEHEQLLSWLKELQGFRIHPCLAPNDKEIQK